MNVVRFSKKDTLAVFLLGVLLAALFVPYIVGSRGLFMDDMAMEEFPRLYFVAQQMQEGIIPLWRPAIWCGARVFSAEYYSSLYYPPLWPFLLLADLDNLEEAYLWLHLVPLFLHYVLAAVGAYFLTRSILRFSSSAAFTVAVLYTFSPAFMYSYVRTSIPWVLALLPWLLLVYIKNVIRPRWWLFSFGGVLCALFSAAAVPPFFWYSLAFCGLVGAGLTVMSFSQRASWPLWRPCLLLLAYLALGFVLAAVYWFPAFIGGGAALSEEFLSYREATGGDGSLPPVYLATMVAPDIFGGLIGKHLWGNSFAGVTRCCEANLSGGLAVMLLALLGAVLPWRLPGRKKFVVAWRAASGVLAAACLFSILCALGRHTPFFGWVWRYLPLVGRFPYPIRYRMIQCLAVALLAGLGIQILLKKGPRLDRAALIRFVSFYLLGSGLIVTLALLLPNDLTGEFPGYFPILNRTWAFPGVMELLVRGDLNWFCRGPLLTFLGGLLIVALAVRFLSIRGFALIIAALAFFETGSNAYQTFYYGTFDRRIISPQHERVRAPSSHPMYRRMLVDLPEIVSEPLLRVATDRPFHDNLQQLSGGFALMGYHMRPLESRFREAIEKAYGRPMDRSIYWFLSRPKHLPFLSNMSVGYLLESNPESPFSGGRTESLKSFPDFYLHPNPEALPRAFTVDRIVESTPYEQLNWLVEGDIRRAVFMAVAPLKAGIGAEVFTYKEFLDLEEGESEAAFDEYFEKLQQANRITGLELGNPNSIELEIEVALPAMLVLTEVWHLGWKARIDGKETKLHRVNYRQRGVWIERGKHRVELNFRPRIWTVGAGVSIFSWAALIIVALVLWIKKKIGRKKAQTCLPAGRKRKKNKENKITVF